MKAAPGRRAIIGETTKSYICRQVIKGEFKTAKAVHQYLNGLGAKIKAKKPLLSKQHKERRLAWAMAHKDWTTDDWRRMVFSDETKVNVFGSDGCKYYWSRPDDALQHHHLDHTVKGGQVSVIVWGCITYDEPGYLRNYPYGQLKLAKQWFVDNNFNSDHIYSWPAQIPDLNPIEHV
ncbi:hypothetical protein G6F43_012576 [Rhizopus delemar]|nr:hypothetical protein G6F43_012576 [Rhizopus delemar]